MNIEFNYLLKILRTVLNHQPLAKPDLDLNWEILFRLAERHGLQAITYAGLQKLHIEDRPDEKIYEAFKLASAKAYAKEAVQFMEGNRIVSCLEDCGIACMPLKGSWLRQYYPHPAMRSMADIDILIKEDRAFEVCNIMKSLGYNVEYFEKGNHDVYKKIPYMNVEIHRSLFVKQNRTYELFTDIWQRSIIVEDHTYLYDMTAEDKFIYILAHMKKHFSGGGTGIRSVLDVWVYLQNTESNLDWKYINPILEKYDLLNFTKQIIRLGKLWMEEKMSTDAEKEDIENFIIQSGLYGSQKNVLGRTVMNMEGGMKFIKLKYLFRRILPPFSHMKILYPNVVRHPYFIIFYWIKRIVHALYHSRKRICSEYRVLKRMDEESLQEIKMTDAIVDES